MKFIPMKKPLEYPVYDGKKCVIPVGAKGVKIAFGASHLSRNPDGRIVTDFDREPGAKRLNVYLWKKQMHHL